MVSEALRFIVNTVFGFIVYAALLRFIMQWLRAPFRNPVGLAVCALTDWAVKPLPGYGGYDWASLGLAWILQAIWLVVLAAIGGAMLAGPLVGFVALMAVIDLIKATMWIVIAAVFVQAILSWLAPDGPLAGVL